MIIQEFNVRSKNVDYDFVDRDALDSEAEKRQVNAMHAAALAYVQTNALCENRGLADRGEIDNRVLAVYKDGAIIGIWMLGCIEYVSGPWDNLTNWNVVNPGADAMLSAVPMSGIVGMDEDDEAEFAAMTARKLVQTPNVGLLSGQGTPVGFEKIHYGIFKEHDDPVSMRARAHHAKVKADPQLDVIETPHPTIPHLTLVEIRNK
jgi:hypothetical protein